MMQIKSPDGALARRVLDHIEDHPGAWRQGVWMSECGTAGCYAYWTVNLAGGRFDLDDLEYVELGSLPPDVRQLMLNHFSADGCSVHLADAAAALLGLIDVDEDLLGGIQVGTTRANRLFKCQNSLADLRALVAELFPAAENAGA